MTMSGRPLLWTRQKAGRLSGWRICSGSTRLMDAHPILNGSLKDIDVYDCEMSELDAIARNTGLADRAAIGARQVGLVVEAKHIDRNASRVGAQANTIKLSRRPIGVADGVGAVANVRVGHNLAVRVRAIGEPQPASGKFRKDVCVQPSEVGLLGLRLTGEVRLDLLRYIHLTPHASNELSHAGSDRRRPSIAGVRMDGRQPRTERPSARACIGRALVRRDLDATAAPFDNSIDGRLAHHDLQGLVTIHRLRRSKATLSDGQGRGERAPSRYGGDSQSAYISSGPHPIGRSGFAAEANTHRWITSAVTAAGAQGGSTSAAKKGTTGVSDNGPLSRPPDSWAESRPVRPASGRDGEGI
jgi:hypothetical protein